MSKVRKRPIGALMCVVGMGALLWVATLGVGVHAWALAVLIGAGCLIVAGAEMYEREGQR
jgi:hypothetical protein